MSTNEDSQFILGEYRRLLDDRHRVSVPTELAEGFQEDEGRCVMAKERPGAISLWNAGPWQEQHRKEMAALRTQMEIGNFQAQEYQRFGRLLSTRHRDVQLAARGRLVIPEGFREFLGADPGSEVILIGAAVCVEIWRPDAWFAYLDQDIPDFPDLLNRLTGRTR